MRLSLLAALTVTSADATAAYTVANLRPVPPDAQIIPAKGSMYAVDVTIAAQTGTTMYNGFYFVARAGDGSTIAPAVGADGTIRGFEVLSIAESAENPFVMSPLRRWLAKFDADAAFAMWELLLRSALRELGVQVDAQCGAGE